MWAHAQVCGSARAAVHIGSVCVPVRVYNWLQDISYTSKIRWSITMQMYACTMQDETNGTRQTMQQFIC